ncbi:MAG: alpha/beta hydrolase [Sphingomicrobium sp.]
MLHVVTFALLALATPQSPPDDLSKIFTFERIAPVAELGAISLRTSGSRSTEIWDRMGNGQRIVRNVTLATLTPVLPSPEKATGTAVIVAPGGGFSMLSMDNEGWPVARWLADHGVAAFVLKYRLNASTADETKLSGEIARLVAAATTSKSGPSDLRDPAATEDALAALDVVRAGATKWGIDPKRVGMLGFSAGAITTMNATLGADDARRPDFIGYVYGPMSAMAVPANAPPMFAALAMDDRLFGGRGSALIDSWHAAGRPVELHLYESGDHGFGMGKPGTTSTMLMPEFLLWMDSRGLLKRH